MAPARRRPGPSLFDFDLRPGQARPPRSAPATLRYSAAPFDELLDELGLGADEVAALRASGAVA